MNCRLFSTEILIDFKKYFIVAASVQVFTETLNKLILYYFKWIIDWIVKLSVKLSVIIGKISDRSISYNI